MQLLSKIIQHPVTKQITLYLCLLLIIGEISRDIFRDGDFAGYISAGKLAWNKLPIYSDYKNTWPPFFSLVSIPLYGLNQISFVGLRLCWLIGIVVANFYIIQWVIGQCTTYQLRIRPNDHNKNQIGLTHPLFLVSFLCTLRIFLEELSNLQINLFILAISMYILNLILNEKNIFAGLLLGLIISVKVYPLIILGFLLFKRKFIPAIYSVIGLAISTSLVFVYFGYQEGVSLFHSWTTTQVVNGMKCEFMNQSIWGWLCGLFTANPRMDGLDYSILNLSHSTFKISTLGIISLLGFFFAYRFYQTRNHKNAWIVQYIITLSLIPIISPLAWKYYYVFLTPLVVLLVNRFQKYKTSPWFYVPILGITFTSELFIGSHFSDITEAMGIIPFSALILSIYATQCLLEFKEESSTTDKIV